MAKILRASLIASAMGSIYMQAAVGESGAGQATAQTTAAPAEEKKVETPKQVPMADGRVLVTLPLKFRRKKETKEVDGKQVEVVTQRPGFDVSFPKHTQETILEIMASDENNLVKDYIVSLVNEELWKAVRAQADENTDAKSFGDLDASLFTIEQLAKDSAGSGGKPEKEDFEKFCAHYVKTMPAVAGVSTDAAKNAASEFMNGKFTRTAYHEGALKSFQNRLATFAASAPDAGDHEEVVVWLQKKVVKLIEAISGGTEY